MAMTIDLDQCTACGDCEPVCPTGSVKVVKGSYRIEAESCTECVGDYDDPQCLAVCPMEGSILPLAA
ncbi:4Fe-4S dicluster domain-containing protein [Parasulfuritortus cantonensis]|uniref:4Fe-4S dicluster domain-containing protein n=1 Tax=Parasulfuritortus cantonensis TaxID=2528202 RepID=A0A4R1BCV5_9PROT|nr:4Fe-4S dicluster domain-containing protein [Parasulfuritortus cantonensis]TCJ14901.1 4Fe-4S dicluster domain-containing protein [Parasulfuritortus cantonensis]